LKSWSLETRAKIACAYSGLVWGLFWIPLRQLQQAGIGDEWASFVFYSIPLFFALVLLPFRLDHVRDGGFEMQLKGLLPALSLVIYSVAFFHTTVVRAMLLFYLTPIWSALLARWILGEPITSIRWFSMALGFAGMGILLGGADGMPLPSNVGDWLAFASGIGWALAAVVLRGGRKYHALDLCIVDFIWAAVIALAFLLLFLDSAGPRPELSIVATMLPWLVPTVMAVVFTGVYASMWGVPLLNPALVGLLFMTEISVGAVTAALWSGEPFGAREVAGVLLISAAGAAESLWDLWRSRTRTGVA
jgi:drug/metabolite transporter (DMT)-like permease